MSYFILVRHGESEYNKEGLWTGWDNPHLTDKGKLQAREAGKALHGIQIDHGFTSILVRTHETMEEIKNALGQSFPVTESREINERNYGVYTKKNKWQIKEEVGEEEFTKIRRSWDYPIPQGESLKQVYERVVPYLETTILPMLKSGKNVLLCSSGNALRSLAKYLENISNEDITRLEIGVGEVYKYTIDETGKVIEKEIIPAASEKGV